MFGPRPRTSFPTWAFDCLPQCSALSSMQESSIISYIVTIWFCGALLLILIVLFGREKPYKCWENKIPPPSPPLPGIPGTHIAALVLGGCGLNRILLSFRTSSFIIPALPAVSGPWSPLKGFLKWVPGFWPEVGAASRVMRVEGGLGSCPVWPALPRRPALWWYVMWPL